jgi:ABC-type multidrug transport system fused ATPase/permease subunit
MNDHGVIVERGTRQELFERRGPYHQLYISQFKEEAI